MGTCTRLKIPLIYHAIGYLTFPIQFNISVRKDHNIFLQTQCNINLMFKGKKGNEVKEYIPPPKPVKKLVGYEKEINLSKINIQLYEDSNDILYDSQNSDNSFEFEITMLNK